MAENDDRPELYNFITEIVDVVHALRPDLTWTAVERAIGPECSTVLLRCAQDVLNETAKELVGEYGRSNLVGDIAAFVRSSLVRGSGA